MRCLQNSDYIKFVRPCLTNLREVIYGRNKIKYCIGRFDFKSNKRYVKGVIFYVS